MAKGSKSGKYGSTDPNSWNGLMKWAKDKHDSSASGNDGAKMLDERRRRREQGTEDAAANAANSTPKVGNLNSPTKQIDYPPDEYTALEGYTSSSHINWELGNNGYNNLSPGYKKMTDNLDSAIAKSGWNDDQIGTPFCRGCGGIVVGVPENKKFSSPYDLADYINKNRIGSENINVGYTSITGTESIAKSFKCSQPNPILIKYDKIGKGMHGAYVSGGGGKKPISVFGTYEDETLLQRNVKTYPVKAYVSNGHVIVHVIAKP